MSELGISYQNPALYENLSALFNPQNFVGENYGALKLQVANKYYAKVQENKGNELELEKIYDEISKTNNSKAHRSKASSDLGRKSTIRVIAYLFLSIILVVIFNVVVALITKI